MKSLKLLKIFLRAYGNIWLTQSLIILIISQLQKCYFNDVIEKLAHFSLAVDMHILVCRRRTGWSSTPGPSSRPCLTCCVSAMAASPLRQAVQATNQNRLKKLAWIDAVVLYLYHELLCFYLFILVLLLKFRVQNSLLQNSKTAVKYHFLRISDCVYHS